MRVVSLHFSRAFDTVCHHILIGKLSKCGLDEGTVRQMENGLMAELRGPGSAAQSLVGGR